MAICLDDVDRPYYRVDLNDCADRTVGSRHPRSIQGIEVRYVAGSKKEAFRPPRLGRRRTDGERSLVCGQDIQNRNRAGWKVGEGGSAGATLGCFVETSTGEVGFLSTNAGIAALNEAMKGDEICRLDVDDDDCDLVIGTLLDFVRVHALPKSSLGVDRDPINHLSIALGVLKPGYNYYANFIPGSALPRVRGEGYPKVGDVVYKFTQELRISRGEIVGIEQCIFIPLGGNMYRFDGVFEIKPDDGSDFDDDGLSGTLVVREGGDALGMVIGVDRTTRNVMRPFPFGGRSMRCAAS